jgi:predicted nucleotidyltransferase
MKRKRDEVLKILEANRQAIRGYGVRSLGLFGSVVRGDDTAVSDLDFVVQFDRKSFDSYMEVKAFLEQLFGCRVDLVIESAIKPRLRRTILQEAVHAEGL